MLTGGLGIVTGLFYLTCGFLLGLVVGWVLWGSRVPGSRHGQ